MKSAEGKNRKIQAANTKNILRLNPELAQARIRATYKAKGYSEEWTEK